MADQNKGLREAIIDRFLREHVGRENLISEEALMELYDASKQKIREVVSEIRRGRLLPIGHSLDCYFVIDSYDDMKAFRESMAGRISAFNDELEGVEYSWQKREGKIKLFDRNRLAEVRGAIKKKTP